MGGKEACALMLMQKGANVNVDINSNIDVKIDDKNNDGNDPDEESEESYEDSDADMDEEDVEMDESTQPMNRTSTDKDSSVVRFLPRHFATKTKYQKVPLFQALVQNDWLGLTFVAMKEMEKFGMSYAKAVEVALHVKKFQFAKRLIEKQVSVMKLQELVGNERTLVNVLAFEALPKKAEKLLLEDILDRFVDAEVDLSKADDFKCTPLHYACLNHNADLLQALINRFDSDDKSKMFKGNKDKLGRSPLMSLFWNPDCPVELMSTILKEYSPNLNERGSLKPYSHLNRGFLHKYAHMDYTSEPPSCSVDYSPLIWAIIHGKQKLIRLFLR